MAVAGSPAPQGFSCGRSMRSISTLRDLRVARMRVLVEQHLRLHDHAVDAVAVLSGLFVDEGLLQRVRMRGAAEALERRDLRVADAADRIHA